MLAQNNEYIREASATVYKLTKEEEIRLQCEAREDYYRTELEFQKFMEEKIAENRKLLSENRALTSENERLRAQLAALTNNNSNN